MTTANSPTASEAIVTPHDVHNFIFVEPGRNLDLDETIGEQISLIKENLDLPDYITDKSNGAIVTNQNDLEVINLALEQYDTDTLHDCTSAVAQEVYDNLTARFQAYQSHLEQNTLFSTLTERTPVRNWFDVIHWSIQKNGKLSSPLTLDLLQNCPASYFKGRLGQELVALVMSEIGSEEPDYTDVYHVLSACPSLLSALRNLWLSSSIEIISEAIKQTVQENETANYLQTIADVEKLETLLKLIDTNQQVIDQTLIDANQSKHFMATAYLETIEAPSNPLGRLQVYSSLRLYAPDAVAQQYPTEVKAADLKILAQRMLSEAGLTGTLTAEEVFDIAQFLMNDGNLYRQNRTLVEFVYQTAYPAAAVAGTAHLRLEDATAVLQKDDPNYIGDDDPEFLSKNTAAAHVALSEETYKKLAAEAYIARFEHEVTELEQVPKNMPKLNRLLKITPKSDGVQERLDALMTKWDSIVPDALQM